VTDENASTPQQPTSTGNNAPAQDGNMTNMGKARLSQSLMLEEQSPKGLLRVAAVFIFAFTLLFVTWAANTRISQVVVSSGEVSPFGSVKTVQHLEGGIVQDIRVRDGDLVEKDEVIMILSPSGVTPERDQLKVRLNALELEAKQLLAIASGDQGDLKLLSDESDQHLATIQMKVFQAKHKATTAQLDVIETQIVQKKVERELLREKAASVKKQLGLIREQYDIRKGLMSKGLQPKLVLLDNQREMARIEGQLSEAIGAQRQITEAIAELESKKLEINARLPMEAAENLGKISSEIAELREVIAEVDDRVRRLTIRSPVRGVVQNLRTETLGGVIPAGETIAEVIPSDVELKVDARVATEDIGFVFKGQRAHIKVLTYDYTRFGDISGTIERISATTNTDETGNPFYLAQIRLDKNFVGDDSEKNRVVPGMTVIADIRTGERTLTEYLLKPIYLAFNEAFRER